MTDPRGRSSRPASRPPHSAARPAQVGEGREGPDRRARAGPRGLGRRAAGLPARGRGGVPRADAVGGAGRCVPTVGMGPGNGLHNHHSAERRHMVMGAAIFPPRQPAPHAPKGARARGVPPALYPGAVETLASGADPHPTCSWAWLG